MKEHIGFCPNVKCPGGESVDDSDYWRPFKTALIDEDGEVVNYCQHCGHALTTECGQCGRKIKRSYSYCPGCGAAIFRPPSTYNNTTKLKYDEDDEEQIKTELMLHIAKEMLKRSVTSRDDLFRTLSTISAVAVPTYLALMTKLVSPPESIPLVIQLLPVGLWIGSLLIGVIFLFPHRESFDLKDVAGIVDVHSNATVRAYRWTQLSCALLIAGVGAAAYVIVVSHFKSLASLAL